MIVRRVIGAALLAAVMACAKSQRGEGGGGGATMTARSIDAVLAAHTDSLMALPGVVGTALGLCEGEKCIRVLLADSSPATRARIPSHLEGYRVTTEVTGKIRPL